MNKKERSIIREYILMKVQENKSKGRYKTLYCIVCHSIMGAYTPRRITDEKTGKKIFIDAGYSFCIRCCNRDKILE